MSTLIKATHLNDYIATLPQSNPFASNICLIS